MDEEGDSPYIRCERFGEMPVGGRLELGGPAQDPIALGGGVVKHIGIEGVEGIEFVCFTDAHPGQDHLFRVGERTLRVSCDEFRLAGRGCFPAEDVERR